VASHYRPPEGAGSSPYPLDFIVDQSRTIRYWKTEYDPVSMIGIIEELLGDTIPPTTPTDVALSRSATLSWSPSTDNIGVDHYRIYQRTVPYFQTEGLIPVATTTSTSAQFPWVLGDPSVNHYFRVTARDVAGNESLPSDTVGEFDYGLASLPGG
jgi:hypothetical protein